MIDNHSDARGSAELLPAQSKCKGLNPAERPAREDVDRRNDRVIDVARQLFVEKGYVGTSLVNIARTAGVATRTVYENLGDKEAIFRAVIHGSNAGFALPQPRIVEGDTLFLALRTAGEYLRKVADHEQATSLIQLMIAERTRFPELIQSTVISIFNQIQRNIEMLFIAGNSLGLVPAGEHDRSARLFLDLVLGDQFLMGNGNWTTTVATIEDLDERIDLFILGRFGPAVARTTRTKIAKSPSVSTAQKLR